MRIPTILFLSLLIGLAACSTPKAIRISQECLICGCTPIGNLLKCS